MASCQWIASVALHWLGVCTSDLMQSTASTTGRDVSSFHKPARQDRAWSGPSREPPPPVTGVTTSLPNRVSLTVPCILYHSGVGAYVVSAGVAVCSSPLAECTHLWQSGEH